MKKIRQFYKKHPDISAYIILSLTFAFIAAFVLIFKSQGGIWGSDKDWKSQHFAIPEYFRIRFYETHDFFPDLALQLGGGQNIFNYAYYGIANPLYLPSYAMPFVQMSTYIQIISIITVLISAFMSYHFFKRHFNHRISLVLSIMFLCSGALIFHSHRHIMFMNYIPFLFGMLLLCEKKDNVPDLLLMAVMTYCIMCSSFYFSVGCFTAVGIYMVYLELSKESSFSFAALLKNTWKKILASAIGCLCSAFLWLPVLSALLSGRAETSTDLSLAKVLVPTIDLGVFLYSGYSIGLTSVAVIAVMYFLRHGKRQDRFLAFTFAGCIVFPVINYLVNATMYIDGKAFIPLTPLALIVCGRFFTEPGKNKNEIRILVIINAFLAAFTLVFNNPGVYVSVITIVEYLISSFVIIRLFFSKKEVSVPHYSVITAFIVCIAVNMSDVFVPRSSINEFYSQNIANAVNETIESDDRLCRFADCIPNDINVNRVISMKALSTNIYSSVSNSDMRDFRFNSSLSENRIRNNAIQNQSYSILFNALMGCRYRIAPEKLRMSGEEPVNSAEGYIIYKNEYAFPLGYASKNTMSEKDFFSLPVQLHAEALAENIITPVSENPIAPNATNEIFADMSALKNHKGVKFKNGVYSIKSKKNFTVTANLDKVQKDTFLVITATADNRIGNLNRQDDIALTINGVKNKLSKPTWKYNNRNYNFNYVISSYEPISQLELTFTKGNYTISDFHIYAVDISVLSNAMENKDEFFIDRDNSLGSSISGTIDVTDDGWFTISLPYDKGFKIKVDGVSTDYTKTNTAFIGFPISKGSHDITITFEAPWRKAGIKLSVAGFTLLFLLTIITFLFCSRKKIDK